jgi:hypothetical protein
MSPVYERRIAAFVAIAVGIALICFVGSVTHRSAGSTQKWVLFITGMLSAAAWAASAFLAMETSDGGRDSLIKWVNWTNFWAALFTGFVALFQLFYAR